MAENLSVPSEFEKPKAKGMNINLLPPSAFEVKAKQGDPWKEIAKATEEVAKLKMENSRLKEAHVQPKDPVIQPIQPKQTVAQSSPAEICKYSSKKEDFKYIDELINKQACEITDLKNELRGLKCQQREEITEMERQLTLKEREYTHEVTSLEVELKSADERYANQVDRLSSEHQRYTEDLQCTLDKVQDELDLVRARSKDRIELLETQYEQLKLTSGEKIEMLMQDLRSKEVMLANQGQQISQLKKYIGETENLPKPSDITRRENESMTAKIKAFERERDDMNSTIQLLNIRLNSVNEVLKLQEEDISKSSIDIEKSKGESLLLTRWREKVFALMVQQKSTAITNKKDENNWKAKVCDLEERLSSSNNQIKQLSHTVSDREAQLSLETNTCLRLQGELSEAQQLALCLDDRIQENVNSAQLLKQITTSVWSKFEEKLDGFNTALSSLKGYGQRISFASSRVEMLQGLFTRREAMLKLEIERGNIPEKDTPQLVQKISDEDLEGSSYLRSELEKVMRERDNLALQLKQDSLTWDNKVASIRAEVAEELETLIQAKTDLENVVREKTQKICDISEKLETSENDLVYASQNIEDLKATLAKQEMNMEQLLDEQRREVENQSSDGLADLERQLNEAKREHAKAVVSLRQVERQSAREKERIREELHTADEHYKRQVDMLQERLKSIEKERNLMMATLRQEGLVGKLRSERQEPITHDWDLDQEPSRLHTESGVSEVAMKLEIHQVHAESVVPEQDTSSPTEHLVEEGMEHENLTTVLEDLKSLTDAVLNDESGSDSDV